MSPQQRQRLSRGLPDYLYPVVVDGKVYYRYLRADGKWRGMGADRNKAIAAAKVLNARRVMEEEVTDRVKGERSLTVEAFVPMFLTDLAGRRNKQGKGRAKATLYEARRNAQHVADHWRGRAVRDITRRDVVLFLADKPDRTANVFRTLLRQIFTVAIEQGLREDNPVEGTRARDDVVKRQRLTMDEFEAVRDVAPQWLRNAMDLSLVSLQSRAEIVAMKWTDEREPGYLFVDRQKVAKDEAGHIRIEIGQDLRDVLRRCRDALASPFVIHRRPKRQTAKQRAKLEHWTQVLPDYLSKAFAEARATAGVPEQLAEGKTPPSFHEIRSLGGDRLVLEYGWTTEEVRLLMGHTSTRMTEVYLDRRGREVRYVDARAL